MTIGIVINGKSADDIDAKDGHESGKLTFQVIKIVALSAVSGFLFGFDTGIISGAMVFIKDHFALNDIWQELIISVTILGAWIFSIMAGQFSDKFGRRNVIIVSSFIFTFGSLLMGFANDKYTLLVGRLIVGAAIGLSSMVIPIYIAEIAPTKIRGSLVTTNNLFITGGQAVSALVAVGFSYLPEPIGWRFMLGIACIPSIIQLIGFFTMPESPRWLMRQDREDEAHTVLQALRGAEVCIENEFNKLREQCGKERPPSVSGIYSSSPTRSILHTPSNAVSASDNRSYIRSISANSAVSTTSEESAIISDPGFCTILTDVLKDRYLRRALLVGCALQAFQQLTGINTVMYYAATIIQMSGVGNKNEAVWMASITAMVNFLTTFIGVYLVDRLGRRQLTLGSLAGVTVSLLILSIGFKVEESYSPLVGFSSDSPIDQECKMFTSCNDCIASTLCGFCYDPSSITNGTCLRANDDASLGSVSLLCSHASNVSLWTNASSALSSDHSDLRGSRFIWSHGSCPAPYSYIILAGLCLYLLAFGPGMGPMPWTINSEIYPTWARTTCCSITTSMSWFFNLLISLTFLTLVKFLTKQGAFGLYTFFGVVGLVFLYLRLPETKGKHLEETYEMFRRKSSRRRVARKRAEQKLHQHQEEEEDQGDALLTDIILRASEKSAANNVTSADESDTRRTVKFEMDTQVEVVMKDQLTIRKEQVTPADSPDISSDCATGHDNTTVTTAGTSETAETPATTTSATTTTTVTTTKAT